ncbi:MAG: CocE/NonD family hydrolase [Clostridiales bacterium]|nr:CocE/NonD family hydrolase [Clostridiales bacterium]
MFSTKWETSKRQYGIIEERHVSIPMSDGVTLDADIFRPDAPGEFPVLLGIHIYDNAWQSDPIKPFGMCIAGGGVEAGDQNFYVRRGYVKVNVNARGTGGSGGFFNMVLPPTDQDSYETIEWLAAQPWCDGNVGMLGVSWFAMLAQRVAHLKPPHLKAIFAPFSASDQYRDVIYHGGILNHEFTEGWIRIVDKPKFPPGCFTQHAMGEEVYRQKLEEALADPDLMAVPHIAQTLKTGVGPIDNYLNYLDCDMWKLYNTKYENTDVPAYLGACWGIQGLHLPGAFTSWENWAGPKKMTIGPPLYLDRPLYQYAYESLRWFDYWLKGVDTGIMDGDPIRLFVVGTGEWKTGTEWPLEGTQFTPFYLHENGLLSEHEFWPNEGFSTFEDSHFNRGSLTFTTPPLVEATEVVGPMVLNLYASSTDTDVLWFVSFLDIDPEGNETLLTRGWLRGSHRQTDPARSKPWQPYHTHTERLPLAPGEIYEFNVEIRPYGIEFAPGHRIGVRVKCVDDEEPKTSLEGHNTGHIWRQASSRVTVYHNADYPSHLLLPVTKGNVIGTFMSGGNLPKEHFPFRRY